MSDQTVLRPGNRGQMPLAILETKGFTPMMVALDAMEKAAAIEVVQIELNDMLGVCVKVTGDVASLQTAIDVGKEMAARFLGEPVGTVLMRPHEQAWPWLESPVEFSPLTLQNVVTYPRSATEDSAKSDHSNSTSEDQIQTKAKPMASNANVPPALGFIETQGFTAVFEAIDTACKAANVEIVGKEKLGGGYVTIIIQGDVSAVQAAVDAGKRKVEGLGKLIAAHVMTGPSRSVLSLLPKA
jgi:microcompartment protein CcmL/EutN